jgi:hypothetical protein
MAGGLLFVEPAARRRFGPELGTGDRALNDVGLCERARRASDTTMFCNVKRL